jgi:hypothetical protein
MSRFASLGFAFVCASHLVAARAGAVTVVNSPFSETPCLTPADVAASMGNPTGFYTGADKCESLCKKAAVDCKQYVRLAFSCNNSSLGDDASYEKKECEQEFGDDSGGKKDCKSGVDDSSSSGRQSLRGDRDAQLDFCDNWEHTCESTCSGVP